jgi:hypothetical protein
MALLSWANALSFSLLVAPVPAPTTLTHIKSALLLAPGALRSAWRFPVFPWRQAGRLAYILPLVLGNLFGPALFDLASLRCCSSLTQDYLNWLCWLECVHSVASICDVFVSNMLDRIIPGLMGSQWNFRISKTLRAGQASMSSTPKSVASAMAEGMHAQSLRHDRD